MATAISMANSKDTQRVPRPRIEGDTPDQFQQRHKRAENPRHRNPHLRERPFDTLESVDKKLLDAVGQKYDPDRHAQYRDTPILLCSRQWFAPKPRHLFL